MWRIKLSLNGKNFNIQNSSFTWQFGHSGNLYFASTFNGSNWQFFCVTAVIQKFFFLQKCFQQQKQSSLIHMKFVQITNLICCHGKIMGIFSKNYLKFLQTKNGKSGKWYLCLCYYRQCDTFIFQKFSLTYSPPTV